LKPKKEIGNGQMSREIEAQAHWKSEAIPAAVSQEFSNAFDPKRLRQIAFSVFAFRANTTIWQET
jgi:hypothetical protein